MTQLTCPKCHGAMRQYERSGVTVDQCTECRGLFLDRGELERLVDAEHAWFSDQGGRPGQGAAPTAPSAPPAGGYGTPYGHGGQPAPPATYPVDYGHRPAEHGYGHPHGRRRKSFLEQLFD